jgi:hypothetical protein
MGPELPTAARAGGDSVGGGERRLAEPHSRAWAALLATILVSFAIQGIAHPAAWEQLLVTCLLAATVVLALRVVGARPSVRRAALAAVAVTVFVSFIEATNGTIDGRATRLANGLLVALAPPAIIVGVVRSLRAKGSVTLDAVIGVLCIYVLLGMLFAFLYGAIDHVGGMPFFAQNEAATVSRCLYFSFTTLCTVGYGDLTARTDLGHTLAVSEALVGQIYLVTIVSLIVSNLGRRREPSTSGAP